MVVAMLRAELETVRHRLLHLHKVIVDAERADVERLEGRLTGHQFLDRLLHDPQFAWLKPLSALIVAMDQWLDDPEPTDATELADELRRLLVPAADGDAFQRRYADLLQLHPAIILAHAAVRAALPHRP